LRLAPALLVLAAVALAGCGTTAKRNPYYADDGPPDKVPAGLDQVPDAVPRDEPFNAFANRPYTVFGTTYVPVVDRQPFRQRGLASWYGRKFQGQKTASGEPYDMFKMTAAHKTLPIPSYAKVTNLANGKSVVVRINDRGPFHSGRIIDLSYAAAAKIGLAAKGSGMVEVERVFRPPKEESDTPAAEAAKQAPANGEGAAPVAAAATSTLTEVPPGATSDSPAPPTIRTPVVARDEGGVWIQLGAFSSEPAAQAFRDKAAGELPWILEPIRIVQRDGLSRVRLGPYRNRDEAQAIAAKVRQSLGYAPAIVDR
jgi:rare lipoprotein A